MSNSSFKLHIVTPTNITEKEITYIRLKDETGFFGILKGHTNFLTVLVPSLCYYTDVNGKEVFLAVDEGILSVREGIVTITSKEVFESDNAEKLAEIIETTLTKRDESEIAFRGMFEGIERSFMEKTIKLVKGSA
ncbi:MAG: F0F1 ATP synthase subunit epsilon [Planctomycetota bacterium]|nr:F0F1 ATP synthase subunit epsilon [Planctomycetota bacterium]MDE2216289.1 F0F1 ATP synthase subunit epsilon [Planctomycetota bacterium]